MRRLIIQNVSVFDSINRKLLQPQTVVIEQDKFSWIGLNDSYEKQESDLVIDGTNKFLFPGMLDCHVHLLIGHEFVTAPYESAFRTKDGEKILAGLRNAQKYLVAGFTTIRDCGGPEYASPSIRDSIASGMHYGPRMLVAEKTIGHI